MDHEIVTAQTCCIKNTSKQKEPTRCLLKDGERLQFNLQGLELYTIKNVICTRKLVEMYQTFCCVVETDGFSTGGH